MVCADAGSDDGEENGGITTTPPHSGARHNSNLIDVVMCVCVFGPPTASAANEHNTCHTFFEMEIAASVCVCVCVVIVYHSTRPNRGSHANRHLLGSKLHRKEMCAMVPR